MRALDVTALIILIIGGLNWGLVGLFDFNLVEALFGEASALSRTVYTLVGLSALWAAGSLIPYVSHNRTATTH